MPIRDGQKDGADGGGGGGGSGDITAVSVSGPLLSGGGASGDVTVTSITSGSPTWTGTVHTFNPGTSQGTPILLGMAQPSSNGQRDSHALQWRGTSYDGAGHNADWRMYADVTSDAGASSFLVQNRKDVAAFTTLLSVADTGLVTVAGKITGVTQATASTDVVTGGRTLTGGTGINAIGDLTADRTISVDTTTIATRTYADTAASTAASGKANTSLTLTAGAGLTGGGDLTVDRTFNVGAGTGITVNANDVAVDTSVIAVTARNMIAGTGLTGGGTLAADRTFTVDQSFSPTWTGTHTFTNTAVPLTTTITDGAAAARPEGLRIAHTTSVTATAGIGVYANFRVEDGTGTDVDACQIVGILRSVGGGAGNNGNLLFVNNVTGTLTNQGHMVNQGFYGHAGFGIAQLSATGVTTTTAQWSVTSNMVQHTSSAATNGGHAFTGTTNTSGARSFFVITPSSNTGTTLSTAVPGFDYQTYTRTWATGAGPAEQIEFKITAPTYAAAAASTFPIATTFAITGAPNPGANMTITKGLAFHVLAGGSQFDGNFGVYGKAPVAQGVGGENVTNNVTNSGSTDGTIPDITDGSVYLNDYVNLRRALFQIGRMLKQDHDQLRANGFLT